MSSLDDVTTLSSDETAPSRPADEYVFVADASLPHDKTSASTGLVALVALSTGRKGYTIMYVSDEDPFTDPVLRVLGTVRPKSGTPSASILDRAAAAAAILKPDTMRLIERDIRGAQSAKPRKRKNKKRKAP